MLYILSTDGKKKKKKEKEKLSTLGTVKKQVYEAVSFYENDWPNSHLSE